jgi:hypothetical protein
MRIKNLFYLFCMALLPLSSCIQDEALNTECDIEVATLNSNRLIGAPVVENDRVVFRVKPSLDLTALAPEFSLTEGATIEPASGTMRDFTSPQTYTVTSQDRKWSKIYTVTFIQTEPKTKYSFEHYEITGKYYDFYELEVTPNASTGENDTIKDYWASGNKAFVIGTKDPNTFPTSVEENGVMGSAVHLETKSASKWGAQLGMPIAAGNLFLGSFNSAVAIMTPRKATQFGIPFSRIPSRLKGWYKYTPGTTVTDAQNNVVEGRSDSLDIYAVFYESPLPDKPTLDGDNVLTDESIVALARLSDKSAKENFTQFDIPFVFRKEIDTEKLANSEYNLAIVFSSSIDGAYFIGAVGSTLIVDEVQLVCEDD